MMIRLSPSSEEKPVQEQLSCFRFWKPGRAAVQSSSE
jgi:hypothetical protein